MKWGPDRITALILVVGCLLLVAFEIDGEVKSILTIAAVYLFVTGYTDRRAQKK